MDLYYSTETTDGLTEFSLLMYVFFHTFNETTIVLQYLQLIKFNLKELHDEVNIVFAILLQKLYFCL